MSGFGGLGICSASFGIWGLKFRALVSLSQEASGLKVRILKAARVEGLGFRV